MGDKLNIEVPVDLDGERLDKVLADLLDVSRSVARGLFDGGVEVDGAQAKPNTRVSRGSIVSSPEPPERQELQPEPVDFGVLFEDDHVLVVDKPPGVVVHPGSGRSGGTLAAGLLDRYPSIAGVGAPGRWGLVHRLDKDTSGALLVALSAAAHETLSAAIKARQVQREYVALVRGTLKPPTGTIEAPIGRDSHSPTRRAVTRDGKWARTHYQVTRNFEATDTSLVRVRLETGRTHQIRVHFAAIGHPVVGDQAYGGGTSPVESPRVFLHAAKLTFEHPMKAEEIVVESPLPDDLAKVLGRIEAAEGA